MNNLTTKEILQCAGYGFLLSAVLTAVVNSKDSAGAVWLVTWILSTLLFTQLGKGSR